MLPFLLNSSLTPREEEGAHLSQDTGTVALTGPHTPPVHKVKTGDWGSQSSDGANHQKPQNPQQKTGYLVLAAPPSGVVKTDSRAPTIPMQVHRDRAVIHK